MERRASPVATNNDRLGRFFFSCVNRTKLKLLQQALLPSVQNPLHGFRGAMLVRRYLQRCCLQHAAVISRTSIAPRNPCKGFCTDGRRACWSSFSFVRFTQLKKNLPNRSLLVATGLARLSTMENAARLKLGMVEDYR